jgi:hypothetical protein
MKNISIARTIMIRFLCIKTVYPIKQQADKL